LFIDTGFPTAMSSMRLVFMKKLFWCDVCETWGFHGNEDSNYKLLGCDTVWWYGRISVFLSTTLSPSYGWRYPEDHDNMILQNIGIIPYHYTASQPRRLQLEPVDM